MGWKSIPTIPMEKRTQIKLNNMKLAKALKLKNKRVKEIKDLQDKIQMYNLTNDRSPSPYDIKQLYEDLGKKIADLTALKVAIMNTNKPQYGDIVKLAELKSQLSFVKGIRTQSQEKVSQEVGYGDSMRTLTTVSVFTTVDQDNMIKSIEEEIENLQEKIDTFNATYELIGY